MRVELAFRQAALRLIPDGGRILAAVSGGGDSVALLHLLLAHVGGGQASIAVAHLDHGLRRGSRADRRFVERLARELGLRCRSDRRVVSDLRRRGESPEEAARRVRRSFLLEAARELDAEWIALGHTLDDQAETVLMRLVRGAGTGGLAGMAECGPGPFVRPLLGIERAALREYLERRGLDFRDDPSNLDLRFDRNRVRRLALPMLQETLNPRAARQLVAAAERLRQDADYLDRLSDRALRRMILDERAGRLTLDAAKLARAPEPIAKRVARAALRRAGVDPRRIGSRQIDALVDLARGPRGRSLHLPDHTRATRRADRLTLHRTP